MQHPRPCFHTPFLQIYVLPRSAYPPILSMLQTTLLSLPRVTSAGRRSAQETPPGTGFNQTINSCSSRFIALESLRPLFHATSRPCFHTSFLPSIFRYDQHILQFCHVATLRRGIFAGRRSVQESPPGTGRCCSMCPAPTPMCSGLQWQRSWGCSRAWLHLPAACCRSGMISQTKPAGFRVSRQCTATAGVAVALCADQAL